MMKFNLMALLVCLCTMICGTAFAYTPPAPTGYVTDTTGSLSASQVAQLNSKISDFNKRTQNEIAVLVIKSIGDSNIEDVTHDTFKSWRVGKSGLDNGVLLVLAIESRKMRLQTGKGVEGDITDLQASDILNSMKTGLRSKDYYGAISLATDKTMGILESRHGQKVDPGQGAQFNKPLPAPETSSAPVAAPVAASCAVGAVGVDTSLTWTAGLILLFVAGIIFARYMIRRNARLTMEALERQAEAELAAEAASRKEAARVAAAQEAARLRADAEAAKVRLLEVARAKVAESRKNVTAQAIAQPVKVVIPSPVPRPTPGSQATKESNRRAAQTAQAVRTQAVVDAAVAGTLVATSVREVTDASAARARREAEARRQEEQDESERRARARREEEARDEARRAQARRDQEDEDRRRRQREDDDRRSSYSSSSSDSSWGGSSSGSDSGFGGGDSGGGGSSSDW